MDATVWLTEVVNADGRRHLPFPLELEWKPGEGRVHLTKGVRASVSVARIKRHPSGRTAMLICTGAKDESPLTIETGRSVYFYLSIEHGTRKAIERCFRFERTEDAEFRALPDTPPVTLPQATLAMTKHS